MAGIPRERRNYSDEERAQALAFLDANKGDLTKTANQTGIPDSTLANWRDGKVSCAVPKLREDKRAELADKFEAIALQCVALLPDKLPDANVHALVGAAKISVELCQLLRNQPTSITESRSLTTDERRDRIAELMDAARYRAGAAVSDGDGAGGAGSPARN